MPATAHREYKKPQHRRERRTANGVPLPREDGRTVAARRFRTLVEAFERQVGSGLTDADRVMIAQAATLQMAAEGMQAAIVRGEKVDPDALIKCTSEARRLLSVLSAKASENRSSGDGQHVQQFWADKYGATAEEPAR